MSLQLVGFGIQQELLVTKAFKLDFGFKEAFHGFGWMSGNVGERKKRDSSHAGCFQGLLVDQCSW